MRYELAADGVLIVHAGFIIFVVGGLIAVWIGYFRQWRWTRGMIFRIAHLLAIALVVAQSYLGIACPLTILENHFRDRAGEASYAGSGCIAYWLHRLIFFTAPPWVFTAVYTTFAALVVGTLVFAPPRFTRRPGTPAQHAGS